MNGIRKKANWHLMSGKSSFAYLLKKFPVFVQTFVAREVEGLASRGRHPEIFALMPVPPDNQEGFDDLRARTKVVPARLALALSVAAAGLARKLPPKPFFRGTWLGRQHRRRREAFWLGPQLCAAGISHIHVHFAGPAARTAWWLRQDFGVSYSITAHANDFLSRADEYPGLRRVFGDAAFVIAVSDFSRRLLAESFPAARFERIYNGMRLGPSPTSVPVTPPLLVAVGRLAEKKGYTHLIKACHILRMRGENFYCEIIGEGPLRKELQAQIESLGLSEVVVLKGLRTQPEIRRSLAAASAFVLPCVEEKSGGMDILPTVITEAMAAGLPVVSTRLAGIPEMVIDGKTGILVAPGDPGAVADAIQKLLSDAGESRAMGAAGRRHAESIFSDDVTIPQLLALLEGC